MFAFTCQKRTQSASNVPLNFQHALTQISIEAKSAEKSASDHRIVKIKGAWIVNAKDKGDLAGDFKWDNLKKKPRQILTGLRASRRMTSLHMARSIRMNSCWMIKRKR